MDNRNQSAFQFSNPVMIAEHFAIHIDCDVGGMEDTLDTPITITSSVPNQIDTQGNLATVQLTVEIGKDDPAFPFFLSITMSSDFRWDDTLPEEVIKQMLSRNAPMLLLGYARPLAAQILSASPIGPIHIPFMNFLPPESKNE